MKRQKHLLSAGVVLIIILVVTGCAPPCPPAQMTTVLLVRHAEYCDPSVDPKCDPDDPGLGSKGDLRAQELAQVARKAGVAAIYTTDTNRTRETVQPLADLLGVEATIYTATQELVDKILSEPEHAGDVVLVAAHAGGNLPTVPGIITELGGNHTNCSIGSEFDNLCIVTICRRGEVTVVNLQYGEPSP